MATSFGDPPDSNHSRSLGSEIAWAVRDSTSTVASPVRLQPSTSCPPPGSARLCSRLHDAACVHCDAMREPSRIGEADFTFSDGDGHGRHADSLPGSPFIRYHHTLK